MDEQKAQLRMVQLAKAVAEPKRVALLLLLRAGRECCQPTCCPNDSPQQVADGICNCELQTLLGLSQSKVSYHTKVLREAELVREVPVGKWSYLILSPLGNSVLDALHSWCQIEEEKDNEQSAESH